MIRVSVRPATVPFLGRRWVAHCERCNVDLPGRHCDRQGAQRVGGLHIVDRHLGLSLVEFEQALASA
jgi:hypothetical protein